MAARQLDDPLIFKRPDRCRPRRDDLAVAALRAIRMPEVRPLDPLALCGVDRSELRSAVVALAPATCASMLRV